jgi:hypothetical protein
MLLAPGSAAWLAEGSAGGWKVTEERAKNNVTGVATKKGICVNIIVIHFDCFVIFAKVGATALKSLKPF